MPPIIRPSAIYWTWTDESPALATVSLLPVVQAFLKSAGIAVEPSDISLAGRILAGFPEYLEEDQRIPDCLAYLGVLTQKPEANIIKLPNISASVPQLMDAIQELRTHGFAVPLYPENPAGEAEQKIRARYAGILGSAVNPVIREGNSDRRLPVSIKAFARKRPPVLGPWSPDSRSHVAHMTDGDFYGSETAVTLQAAASVCYEFVAQDGTVTTLKKGLPLLAGDILDAAVMNVRLLRAFYEAQIQDARRQHVLFSLHVKATMMKVSDPVIFGHAVTVFFAPVFRKHASLFRQLGINPDNGLGDLYSKIESLPDATQAAIKADIQALYGTRPALAMVDAKRGITSLHVPNSVIIDASIPAMIRDSGRMWGPDGQLQDTKAVIPDRCYATAYKAIIEDCRRRGALDPATMGSVPNVGLMAQQAEEYGSHDKTFLTPGNGLMRVRCETTDAVLLEQKVESGDIFRSCRTTDIAIRDWVKLAVHRARATEIPALFWLDRNRAHDAHVIRKVESCLREHDLRGLDIRILDPASAMECTLDRIRLGQDTLSVTGNVMRDYLTDLFPILEAGTSAKMLSIVPLLAGGGLFETGAGGSAPNLFQQFLQEGHLAWDSLGEFSGLMAALEHYASAHTHAQAALLSQTLDQAIGAYLHNNRSPVPAVGGMDTRVSHFYLAMYWAQALAEQTQDARLRARFAGIARRLVENEPVIRTELKAIPGTPVDIGGYYQPDIARATRAMRPSRTFNALIDSALAE